MMKPEEIRALLGGPRYRRLFDAARRRLEEAGGGPARSATLADLDDDEREALADLFGRVLRPGVRVRLRLDELDEALRRSRAACGLVEVLETLGGPIADRKALRRSAAEARQAIWARAARHPAVVARPALGKWLEEVRRIGLVRRLAALVLRAVAYEMGRPAPPSSALERRLLWEEVGVICDPLSPNVLVLGLRPSGEAWPARHLRDAAGAGEPVRLTLRQLARFPLAFDRAEPVYVCENPAVVAVAADRLCTEGVPSTAAFRLLEALRSAGCAPRFHGDFDWGGLWIMNEIYARFGGEPWRFDAAHYREALARGLGTSELGPRAVEALWDKDLGRALAEAGRAVFEEQVVDALVGDLQARSSGALPVGRGRAAARELD